MHGIADSIQIVPLVSFEHSSTDQRGNFGVPYFDHQATQPVALSLAVCAHALSCGIWHTPGCG
jgi:hypothetical protein